MKKNVIITIMAIGLAVLSAVTINQSKELKSALAEADYFECSYNETSNAYADMKLNYYDACGKLSVLQAQFDYGKELAQKYVVESLQNGSTESMPVTINELEYAGFLDKDTLESIWS